MKRNVVIIITLAMVACLIIPATTETVLRANAVFSEASVYLYDDYSAHFTASTMIICSTISVSSCSLQVYANGRWKHHSYLSLPGPNATNTAVFGALADYSSSFPASGRYRIKATFSGGGESVTRYSNARTR